MHRGVLDRHQKRIGLHLQHDVELDVLLGQRRDHRLTQVVVAAGGTASRGTGVRVAQARPERVLHRLAFAEQVRHAAEVLVLERAGLGLCPEHLHERVQDVRVPGIEEVEQRRVLQLQLLELRRWPACPATQTSAPTCPTGPG